MTEESPAPDTLSVLVLDQQSAGEETPGMHLSVVARHQAVDLGVVKENLKRVQSEIETLLERLDTEYRAGFALKQVELSLSVSAEGSIGIVTPGLDAAITLVYSRA